MERNTQPMTPEAIFSDAEAMLIRRITTGLKVLGGESSSVEDYASALRNYFLEWHVVNMPGRLWQFVDSDKPRQYGKSMTVGEYKSGDVVLVIWNQPPSLSTSAHRFRPTDIWLAKVGEGEKKVGMDFARNISYVPVGLIHNGSTGWGLTGRELRIEPRKRFRRSRGVPGNIYLRSSVCLSPVRKG